MGGRTDSEAPVAAAKRVQQHQRWARMLCHDSASNVSSARMMVVAVCIQLLLLLLLSIRPRDALTRKRTLRTVRMQPAYLPSNCQEHVRRLVLSVC